MRIGCLIPIVALALIIGGGQSVYTGLTNRKPVKVTMESLAKWLEIVGGEFDLLNATYATTFGSGKASSIHVPLVLHGEDSESCTIHVLVETDDSVLVGLANQMKDMEKGQLDEAKVLKFMLENRDKLRVSRTVVGLVKYGMDSGKQERKIKGMYKNLSPTVIQLKEGGKPDMMVGFLMLIAGLAIAVAIFLKSRGKPDPSPGPPPPLPPAAHP